MKRFIALLFICSLASTSCSKNSSATDDDSTGGTTTFTSAQIAKSWTSDCTAFSDSTIGSSYFKNYLTLNSDGSFMFQQYMHTASDCNNASYVTVFTIYGAYSVGSVVSGSTQAIAFAVTTTGGLAPDLMIVDNAAHTPSVSTIETNWNTDCGGTSPYCTLVSGSCTLNSVASGAHSASKNMTCISHTFPNTGNNTIYNIGTYDGSTLTLGAGVAGVPGVFSSGSLPGAVSVAYH